MAVVQDKDSVEVVIGNDVSSDDPKHPLTIANNGKARSNNFFDMKTKVRSKTINI